ncbi:MAG: hypothetical protein QOF51_3981 [Chloroflexota bacterium]|jgi:hypothetical protein|nr:hypothetical protein [Chloroflexota bacterium]
MGHDRRYSLPRTSLAALLLATLGWVLILMTMTINAEARPSQAQVATDTARLEGLRQQVEQAAVAGDWDQARSTWREFQLTWLDVEDGFRDVSIDGYTRIETAMLFVSDALKPDAPDLDVVRSTLGAVGAELAPFL